MVRSDPDLSEINGDQSRKFVAIDLDADLTRRPDRLLCCGLAFEALGSGLP